MENNVNNINARLIVDVPAATSYVMHSSELKQVYFNWLRMSFLNYRGQDYFVLHPEEERTWEQTWKNQTERRYIQEGDYRVDLISGEQTVIDLDSETEV